VAIPFQTDLKIVIPEQVGRKPTLHLSPTGDIQLSDGHDKLTYQLIRAIVNDQAIGKTLLNKKGVKYKYIQTLITIILRSFRQNQLDDVGRSDPDLSGFSIWRRAAGTTDQFGRISDKAVSWKYLDENVENGFSYEYGISKVFKDVYETDFLETMDITPSSFVSRQEIAIGEQTIAIPGSNQVLFYVDFNRRFKGSELLESLERISLLEDQTDPRHYIANVVVNDLRGNQVSVATGRVNIT